MSIINISNLTFGYDSYDNIFENVSFMIDTDWKLGFTGRNGRGKTTFLKLLLGKYEYKGSISTTATFDYFPYEVKDKTKDTIDIINEIITNYELWELNKELKLLDISEDVLYRPFLTLSNGEQTKVLLAALFLKQNKFLLIDEPTNHLDINARKKVSEYLRTKEGFILVSHDKTFLDNCIDHILSINKTNIEIQKGNFSSWWENKQMNDNFELQKNKILKDEIKKLSQAAKRTSEWSEKTEETKYNTLNSGVKPDRGFIGHKSAKMMKRSKSIEQRKYKDIQEKSNLLKNIETAEELILRPLEYNKRTLVEISDLSIFYGDKRVCNNVELSIKQGDRIAIIGKNGSGKSSILKLIDGEDIDFTGNFKKGNNLIISYVSQETSHLKGNLKDFAIDNEIDEPFFKAILRKLDFERIQFEKDIRSFSEGQKKKVLIAKSLSKHAHLYIWDEPLNFVDIISRMQIRDLILKSNATMIFVEHDKDFIDTVATKIINI